MSSLTLLSLVFVIAKLADKLDWAWWVVLSPIILQLVLGAFIVLFWLVALIRNES